MYDCTSYGDGFVTYFTLRGYIFKVTSAERKKYWIGVRLDQDSCFEFIPCQTITGPQILEETKGLPSICLATSYLYVLLTLTSPSLNGAGEIQHLAIARQSGHPLPHYQPRTIGTSLLIFSDPPELVRSTCYPCCAGSNMISSIWNWTQVILSCRSREGWGRNSFPIFFWNLIPRRWNAGRQINKL